MDSRVFILLATLLAFQAAWAKLDVLVEHPTLSAKPGDKVQLKCVLQNFAQPLVLKNFMVQWFTRGKQVAEFDDTITINKPGFSMSLDAIGKGDATLTIESFTPDDAGNYRCHVYYNSDTNLKQIVLSDSTKPKEEEDNTLSTLTTCESILDKKLDIIIKWSEKVDAKLDELKKCPK
ncbi:unnamed protein product [Staurois parvus]|uniref:Ig-like domain-containing protein n=1 Tax=Staurois parvus TaxID=386267 RepID=A0ABN9AMQ3_9NEOB|nr:unnamed protein product [Staurois parvus]